MGSKVSFKIIKFRLFIRLVKQTVQKNQKMMEKMKLGVSNSLHEYLSDFHQIYIKYIIAKYTVANYIIHNNFSQKTHRTR